MAKQTGSYDFTAARAAAEMADDISQHFWTKSTGGTTDIPTGSYVTEVPEEEFTDPNHVNYCSGGNLVMQSNSIRLRLAALTLAELTTSGIAFKDGNGDTLAEFGTNGINIKGKYNDISGVSHWISYLAASATNTILRAVKVAQNSIGLLSYFSTTQVDKDGFHKYFNRDSGVGTGLMGINIGTDANGDEEIRLSGIYDDNQTHFQGGYVRMSALDGDGYEAGFYDQNGNATETYRVDAAYGDVYASGFAQFGALDNGLFDITTETLFTSTSISGGSHKYNTVDINDASRAKYYPLGIVGWNSPDTSQFVPARMRLSSRAIGSATVAYDIRNVGSSSVSGKVTCDILWLKVTV